MVMFHSYISLPEGKMDDLGYPHLWNPPVMGAFLGYRHDLGNHQYIKL